MLLAPSSFSPPFILSVTILLRFRLSDVEIILHAKEGCIFYGVVEFVRHRDAAPSNMANSADLSSVIVIHRPWSA